MARREQAAAIKARLEQGSESISDIEFQVTKVGPAGHNPQIRFETTTDEVAELLNLAISEILAENNVGFFNHQVGGDTKTSGLHGWEVPANREYLEALIPQIQERAKQILDLAA